jgi:hypothetical protein
MRCILTAAVVVAIAGCPGGGDKVAKPTEPMPLPGEGSADDDPHQPDYHADPAEHPGVLSQETIESVMRTAHDPISQCYKSLEWAGSAMTIFVIGTNGAVTTSATSGVAHELARCMDGVISRLTFPSPEGGTVKVRYPCTFVGTEVACGRPPSK